MTKKIICKFLSKMGKGLLFAALGAAVTWLAILFWHTVMNFESDAAAAAGMVTVIVVSLIVTSAQMAWNSAKYEVEDEYRRVQDALKGKL